MDVHAQSSPSPGDPPHPGFVLQRDFLERYEISQAELALHIGVPASNLNALIHGHRGITPHFAWLLGMALGTRPEFWMEAQAAWDLARTRPEVPLPPMPEILERPAQRRRLLDRDREHVRPRPAHPGVGE